MMTFTETPLHVALMIVVIFIGYFIIMWAMAHKGKHTFKRCYLPLILGLAIFSSGWIVMIGWHPEEYRCQPGQHCFPWGN